MPTGRFHPAAVMTLALGALFAAPCALAVTFTVNSILDQPDDLTIPGTCHTKAGACTLRAAVMQANRATGAGVTIILPAGTYALSIFAGSTDGEEDGDLNLTTPTTVQGDQPIMTIFNGFTNYDGGGIYNDGLLTVDHAAIYGNRAGGNGGGIYSGMNGLLTLANSTVGPNNLSYDGGGIFASNDLNVVNSTLTQNQAAVSGGGIYSDAIYPAGVHVVGSTIVGNRADVGGGALIYANAPLTLTDSIVKQNVANQSGGGIHGFDSEVTNSSISQNQAGSAGGGLMVGGFTRVSGSTFSQNHAGTNGGGIYSQGYLILINSTVALNSADDSGGGIFNAFGATANVTANVYNTSIVFNGADFDRNGGAGGGVFNANGETFNLRNSIVAGNDVGNTPIYDECFGTLTSYGRNLFGADHACTITIGSGSFANLNSFNFLGPLQNNGGPTLTVALLPGSNAIDFGDPVQGCVDNNSVPITTDQRGQPRVVGAACDVGAYEYNPTAPPLLVNAASRRTHGGAPYDLPLSLVDIHNPATEPRQGPTATIVFTFDKPIASATAGVTESAAVAGTLAFSGNGVIVPLTAVPNQQYVTVSLTNVASTDGGTGGFGSARIGFLTGDVNGNRVVTLSDVGLVNAQLAQGVSASNFLRDVNVSGTLSIADKAIANANVTKSLPGP